MVNRFRFVPRFRSAFGRSLLAGALAAWAALGSADAVSAQAVPPGVDLEALAQSLSPDEIVARLEASGLSRAQVRDRLRRAGYDPALADRYFDAMESGESLEGMTADATFMEALQGIGVTLRSEPEPSARPDPLFSPDDEMVNDSIRFALADSLLSLADSLLVRPDRPLRVFGRGVFRRVSTDFTPLTTGPVGDNYVLGPGDELLLVITGDVELAYTLNVTREGYVVIPDVGQVSVNGLTLEQLEDRLYDRLGSVYSGVSRSADATTRFDVSLGTLRTNQVRVLGAVRRPGAYQLSSVSTVLEALYQAGGPTDQGSFRHVLLRRAGEPADTVDLYPYLTAGALDDNVRIQEGDVVFVPPVGPQVTLGGMVRQPAIFEIRDGEGLPALIRYAGGLLPDARTDVAQVTRILPPAERVDGRDRILLDAPVAEVLAGMADFGLLGGDEVTVFSVTPRVRQKVSIAGAVWRPGEYELRSGTTVGSLVERAGGLLEEALAGEVLLTRLDLATGDRSARRVDLVADPAGPLLQEFDQVAVFARDSLNVPDSVAIYGLVKEPGRYPLADGLTAGDLVLLAGGFRKGALPWSAEVVQRDQTVSNGFDGSLSTSRFVRLRPGIPYPDPELLALRPDSVNALPAEFSLPLGDADEVFIRRLPGYLPPRRVAVEGEVPSPGLYQLTARAERFSSVLERAGGLTGAANVDGVRLIRDGVPVGVDYTDAVANRGSLEDPVLEDGDRIVVPGVDNTVLVRGAVVFESRVIHRPGMSLGDFIDQAGGYSSEADEGRTSVEYPNGARATVSRTLWIFKNSPRVEPGSVIFVPARPERDGGFDWDTALSRVLAVGSTLATIFIAVNR